MMDWFYCWLHKRVEKALRPQELTVSDRGSKYGNVIEDRPGGGIKSIDFTMLFAEGGVVLRQSHYDPIKDRSYNKMYLIPEDQDVPTRVGEIVALEMLRV